LEFFNKKHSVGPLMAARREFMAQSRPKTTPEQEKALVDKLNAMTDAPPPCPDVDLSEEDKSVTFKRMVPT